jgi:hypothetical protein
MFNVPKGFIISATDGSDILSNHIPLEEADEV